MCVTAATAGDLRPHGLQVNVPVNNASNSTGHVRGPQHIGLLDDSSAPTTRPVSADEGEYDDAGPEGIQGQPLTRPSGLFVRVRLEWEHKYSSTVLLYLALSYGIIGWVV